jgi:hypothetical protein
MQKLSGSLAGAEYGSAGVATPSPVGSLLASTADLAVAPDRTVLLVWTNGPTDRRGSTGVAWRTPGRRFGGRFRPARDGLNTLDQLRCG